MIFFVIHFFAQYFISEPTEFVKSCCNIRLKWSNFRKQTEENIWAVNISIPTVANLVPMQISTMELFAKVNSQKPYQ